MLIREAQRSDRAEIEKIYRAAFPVAERKSEQVLFSERYRITVAEEDGIAAFAAWLRGDGCALVDYLAVDENRRGGGIGAKLLGAVQEQAGDVVFLEIETPAAARNDEERVMRERRRQFYLRQGFNEQGIRVMINGVDMIVLTDGTLSTAEAEPLYYGIYERAFADLPNVYKPIAYLGK